LTINIPRHLKPCQLFQFLHAAVNVSAFGFRGLSQAKAFTIERRRDAAVNHRAPEIIVNRSAPATVAERSWKLVSHEVAGFITQNHLHPEGTPESTVAFPTVPSGRILFSDDHPARCAGLISNVPSGLSPSQPGGGYKQVPRTDWLRPFQRICSNVSTTVCTQRLQILFMRSFSLKDRWPSGVFRLQPISNVRQEQVPSFDSNCHMSSRTFR